MWTKRYVAAVHVSTVAVVILLFGPTLAADKGKSGAESSVIDQLAGGWRLVSRVRQHQTERGWSIRDYLRRRPGC
jgi:hypothetical protein